MRKSQQGWLLNCSSGREPSDLLVSCPRKYIIRGQLSLSKVLANPALVGDRPPLQSNSHSLLKLSQLVGRLLQHPSTATTVQFRARQELSG